MGCPEQWTCSIAWFGLSHMSTSKGQDPALSIDLSQSDMFKSHGSLEEEASVLHTPPTVRMTSRQLSYSSPRRCTGATDTLTHARTRMHAHTRAARACTSGCVHGCVRACTSACMHECMRVRVRACTSVCVAAKGDGKRMSIHMPNGFLNAGSHHVPHTDRRVRCRTPGPGRRPRPTGTGRRHPSRPAFRSARRRGATADSCSPASGTTCTRSSTRAPGCARTARSCWRRSSRTASRCSTQATSFAPTSSSRWQPLSVTAARCGSCRRRCTSMATCGGRLRSRSPKSDPNEWLDRNGSIEMFHRVARSNCSIQKVGSTIEDLEAVLASHGEPAAATTQLEAELATCVDAPVYTHAYRPVHLHT